MIVFVLVLINVNFIKGFMRFLYKLENKKFRNISIVIKKNGGFFYLKYWQLVCFNEIQLFFLEEVDLVRFELASELVIVYEKDVSVIMYDIYLKIVYKYQCIYIFKKCQKYRI